MVETSARAVRLLQRFQGDLILGIARAVFVIAGGACLLALLIGLLVAFYFQLRTQQSAAELPVPPPYVAPPAKIDLGVVDAHLQPPTNIRFIVTRGAIDKPITAADTLGYFDADSANGLAQYPDDFDILGGSDAGLFERSVFSNAQRRAALRPTAELVQQINSELPGLQGRQHRRFEIRVVARDSYGGRSDPVAVGFELQLGSLAASTPPAPEPETRLTDLQRLARDIALVVDPDRTPTYFDAYNRALQVPRICGANDGDSVFVANYRAAFDHARPQLKPQNIEPFYAGVCDGWRRSVSDQAAARARAEAARNDALRQNAAARANIELERTAAWVARNAVLMFVGGTLLVFLTVSVLLAFLALENHSRAVRRAVDMLVVATRQKVDGGI